MIAHFLNTFFAVLLSPVAFYRDMPRSGGFPGPLLFVVGSAILAALIQAVDVLFIAGFTAAMAELARSIIVIPVLAVVVSGLIAIICFFIWKLLGSDQTTETAYRCIAYASVVLPVFFVAEKAAHLFVVAVVLGAGYLLVVASEWVHGISKVKALIIFGLLSLVFIWRCMFYCCSGSGTSVQIDNGGKNQSEFSEEVMEKSVPVQGAVSVSTVQDEMLAQPNELVDNVGAIDNLDVQHEYRIEKNKPVGSPVADKKPVVSNLSQTDLAAESLDEALGKIVKEIAQATTSVGEDLKRGFESGLESVSGDDAESPSAAEAVVTETVEKVVEKAENNVTHDIAETVSKPPVDVDLEPSLTPQELGNRVGQLIKRLSIVAEGAVDGFEKGVQSQPDQPVDSEAVENAGRVLGEFLKGFQEAIDGLEVKPKPEGFTQ